MQHCRQQAQESVGAVSETVAAMTASHTRRTTAEISTQYMLGDLDAEPLTAHAHAWQLQNANCLSIDSSGSEGEPAGQQEDALAGLTQTHTRNPHEGFDNDKLTQHSLRSSRQEEAVTAANHDQGNIPVSVDGKNFPSGQQCQPLAWGSANPPQKYPSGDGSSPAGTPADSVSISVMAGSNDASTGTTAGFGLEPQANSPPAWHGAPPPLSGRSRGRAVSEYSADMGQDVSKGRAGRSYSMAPHAWSPLRSIQEDHDTTPKGVCCLSDSFVCHSSCAISTQRSAGI